MNIYRFFHRLNNSIGGGAIVIAFFSIVSKIVGLYRDRLLASTFGASRLTDIYFASFKLPDFIFNILVLGALTSSFIPVFQRVWHSDEKKGIELSNSILNILLIFVFFLSILLFITAPFFTPWLVPGFSADEIHTTVVMTRFILFSLIFFTASNVFSGVLNSWKKFFTFALSSVVYNIGIIIGIVVLYPLIGLYGLALGVVLGSVLHLVVQLLEALHHGWRYHFTIRISEGVGKIFTLMIPRTIGLAGNQIAIVITTILASTLAPGSLTVFNYANNLQSFPVGIFGVSLAVAAFPSFSKTLAENNVAEFSSLFSKQFRRILYFLVPLSFTILLLRAQIVRVILGTGSFDWEATRLTAQTLGFFSLSLWAQGLTPLLARSFYALEDTKTPVLVSFIDIGLTILCSFIFIRPFGIMGLAFADSLAAIISMVILYYALHRRIGSLNDRVIAASCVRIIVISLIGSSLTYLGLQLMARLVDTHTFIGIFAQGAVAGLLGLGGYFLLSILLGFDEIEVIKRYLLKFLKPLRNAGK